MLILLEIGYSFERDENINHLKRLMQRLLKCQLTNLRVCSYMIYIYIYISMSIVTSTLVMLVLNVR